MYTALFLLVDRSIQGFIIGHVRIKEKPIFRKEEFQKNRFLGLMRILSLKKKIWVLELYLLKNACFSIVQTRPLSATISHLLFGQRPREGTKSCRMGRNFVRTSIRTYVRTYVRPPGYLSDPSVWPSEPSAGLQIPLAGPQIPLAAPQTPLAGPQTPLACP